MTKPTKAAEEDKRYQAHLASLETEAAQIHKERLRMLFEKARQDTASPKDPFERLPEFDRLCKRLTGVKKKKYPRKVQP